VEKIYNFSILRNAKKNFGGQLFGDATGPISIVFYQKGQPTNPTDTIAYYAPKTYIKSNIIEGLNIDFSDLKYLPREECQNPDTKIWKITMWGGMKDWELIKKLNKHNECFKSYLSENNIEYGSGLHPKENEENKISIIGKHIGTSKISKYYTPKNESQDISKEFRKNNKNLFKQPLAVIKEGITNKNILSSYFDYDIFYNKAVYGFSSKDPDKLKSIVITFNSQLATYFFFLTSSSWGLERDRIVLTEYLNFPYQELDLQKIKKLKFSKLNFDKNESLFNKDKISTEINKWNLEISNKYNLSYNDLINISDLIQISIDLFHRQEKSTALFPILQEHVDIFSTLISNELNNFLAGQDLFANATIYNGTNRFTPLMMIKISFDEKKKEIFKSNEFIDLELKKLDKNLWEEKATNIFFRKKINYKSGNDIFIIRPNQRRFWSKSMALEDASELILEILNKN